MSDADAMPERLARLRLRLRLRLTLRLVLIPLGLPDGPILARRLKLVAHQIEDLVQTLARRAGEDGRLGRGACGRQAVVLVRVSGVPAGSAVPAGTAAITKRKQAAKGESESRSRLCNEYEVT